MKFELDSLIEELAECEHKLNDSEIYSDPPRLRDLMRRKKRLDEIVGLYVEYRRLHETVDEDKALIETESDTEIIAMAREELESARARITELEEALKIALLPKDENDDKNIIMEIRAGAGGEEASLFAAELSRAYTIYAEENDFSVEMLDSHESES